MRLNKKLHGGRENGLAYRLAKNQGDFNISLDDKFYNNNYLDEQICLLRCEIAFCNAKARKLLVSQKDVLKKKKFLSVGKKFSHQSPRKLCQQDRTIPKLLAQISHEGNAPPRRQLPQNPKHLPLDDRHKAQILHSHQTREK